MSYSGQGQEVLCPSRDIRVQQSRGSMNVPTPAPPSPAPATIRRRESPPHPHAHRAPPGRTRTHRCTKHKTREISQQSLVTPASHLPGITANPEKNCNDVLTCTCTPPQRTARTAARTCARPTQRAGLVARTASPRLRRRGSTRSPPRGGCGTRWRRGV